VKGQYRKYGRKSSRKGTPGKTRSMKAIEVPFDREDVQRILSEGLHSFAVDMGRLAIIGLLEDEVAQLCGEWHVPDSERQMVRYGAQSGWVAIAGQKVALPRPRIRRINGGGEGRLSRYELFQQRKQLPEAVLRRMVRGVSCRDYQGVVDTIQESYGIKKSSVSRHFKTSLAGKLKKLGERRWDGTRFVTIFIDGKVYAGNTLVVALGVKADGTKWILGLRQGATENAEVCKDLLEDLTQRGVAVNQMTLFVLDGSQALASAVRRVWGRYAVIQRCQVHKRGNLRQYVTEEYWGELDRRLNEAWYGNDYEQSLVLMKQTTDWLENINPDAARSLREGMEDTLAVVRLGLPALLRKSLSNTNIIESAFSLAGTLSGRVKRWRRGAMRWRWCAAGLMSAEVHFHKIPGYQQIPVLIVALDAIGKQEGLDLKSQVA
jgi:putative transposase